MHYRREIDGLRAIAVLPVILFHAGFSVFSGGYIGVDIFFVISGYLITSILIGELEQGDFSVARFYERRARRILPALFVVMFACLPFASMWMLPSQLKEFSQSLVAVVFFASNVMFWRQDGYFSAAAELKPLLHTWSLAVEEQYYLLFPIFLLVLWRLGRQRVFWSVVAVAVLSLLLAEWGWRNKPSANFYLAPTRAWELLSGSICAFLTVGKAQRSSNALSAIGLALIVVAIFVYDENTPFPSAYALVPVLGTTLIILYAARGTWVARLLSLRGFVGVGLISYSAYLWHQPLLAFARLRSSTEPDRALMAALAAASLLLAWATWYWVELAFRKRANPLLESRCSVFAASVGAGIVFVAIGLAGHVAQGNIFDKYDARLVDLIAKMKEGQEFTWENKKKFRMKDFPRNGRRNFLLIGDSNSGDLLNALILEFSDKYNFSSATIRVGCGNLFLDREVFGGESTAEATSKCVDSDVYDGKLLDLIEQADYVFLASSWREFEVEFFPESWRKLNERFGEKFFVFGAKNIELIERDIYEAGFNEVFQMTVKQNAIKKNINKELYKIVAGRFIDPANIFCSDGECKVFVDGRPIFYDESHITVFGVGLLRTWLVNFLDEKW